VNRLDPTRAPEPSGPLLPTGLALTLSWALPVIGVAVAAYLGHAGAPNPVDRAFLTMAYLPLGLLVGDLWTAGVAVLRRRAETPLRVPLATPLILGCLHIGLGAGCLRLIGFDTLYRYAPRDAFGGVYEARWAIALLVVAGSILGLVGALLEGRLLRWVLISERTAAPRNGRLQATPADQDLGPENVYEAQVLLNNLGYEFGAIDGVLTPETSAALQRFQETAGVESSGKVTALTMIELRNRWATAEASTKRASLWAMARHVVRTLVMPFAQVARGLNRSSK